MRSTTLRASILAAVSFSAVPALAQVIAWGTPQNIAADTDVSTLGTGVAAFNFGNVGTGATTVNGVTFAPFVVTSTAPGVQTTVGDYSVEETVTNLLGVDNLGTPNGAQPALTPEYAALVRSGIVSAVTEDIVLTMRNLVVGQAYQFQFFSSFPDIFGADSFVTATGGGGGSVTVLPNREPGLGGLGQYAVGTFVATGSTQSVVFSGSTDLNNAGATFGPVVNGFQLRTAPVPEPGALVSLGGLTGAFLLRRRRAGK